MLPKTVTTSLKLVGTVSPKSRKKRFLQIVCSKFVSIGGVAIKAAGWQPRVPWLDSELSRYYKNLLIENQWMSVDKKSV